MSASPFFEGPNPEDCQICLGFCREKGVSWLFFCATRAILLRPNFMQWLFKCSKPLKIINPNSDVAAAALPPTGIRQRGSWKLMTIPDWNKLEGGVRTFSSSLGRNRNCASGEFCKIIPSSVVLPGSLTRGLTQKVLHRSFDGFFFGSSSSSAWLLMGTHCTGINLKQRSHTARPEIDRCVTIYASFWTRNKLTPL